LKLDNFEYSYLCPLLEQTGLYSGHTDVILTAQKLSQYTQNICHIKKKNHNSQKDTHEYIKKKSQIHFFLQCKTLNWETHTMSYENILIACYRQHILLEIYLFKPHCFVIFEEYFYKVFQPTIKNLILEFSKKNTLEESILICVIFILIYKIWKIENWYSVISQLAFDSQEIGIAKHFVQMAKLEYNMIFMLMNLFK
jgi:hypothetical protein